MWFPDGAALRATGVAQPSQAPVAPAAGDPRPSQAPATLAPGAPLPSQAPATPAAGAPQPSQAPSTPAAGAPQPSRALPRPDRQRLTLFDARNAVIANNPVNENRLVDYKIFLFVRIRVRVEQFTVDELMDLNRMRRARPPLL